MAPVRAASFLFIFPPPPLASPMFPAYSSCRAVTRTKVPCHDLMPRAGQGTPGPPFQAGCHTTAKYSAAGTQRARRPLRPELAAPLGVWPSSQLAGCTAGRRCWRLCRDVAVLPGCTVYRISSSARGCPDRFNLDQPPWSVFAGWPRTVVNCNPNCNLLIRSDLQSRPLPANSSIGLLKYASTMLIERRR